KPLSCCCGASPGAGGRGASPGMKPLTQFGPTAGNSRTSAASGAPRPTLSNPMSGMRCASAGTVAATVSAAMVAARIRLFVIQELLQRRGLSLYLPEYAEILREGQRRHSYCDCQNRQHKQPGRKRPSWKTCGTRRLSDSGLIYCGGVKSA